MSFRMSRGRCRIILAQVLILLTAALLLGGCAGDGQESFSIIALPDTQYYSHEFPDIFVSQTRWIAANADRMNTAFVLHEGDIVDGNTDRQWRNADKAMSLLDGKVPYIFAVGNHDMGPKGPDLFNKYFPASRFEKQPWYGGHYGTGNENSYCLFEAGGMKFLVISLVYVFDNNPALIAWANKIVAEHSDRRTIVLTHFYMTWDGRRTEGAWEKFISRHKNIFMVICGHITKGPEPGVALRSSLGVHGNSVHQILANYQPLPEGGSGYMRIMRFMPKKNTIYVYTYSPYLNRYIRDKQNEFILEYDMKLPQGDRAVKHDISGSSGQSDETKP